MKKVRLTDDQFLSVIRAALCSKVKRDGTMFASQEIKEKAKQILESKNKSEG